MIVDDSDFAREMHRELLEEQGSHIVEATNGLEAISLIQESTDYDLILMDLVMPVMSGTSATREIKALLDDAGKDIPIICLAAEGSDMQIKEAMEAGAFECMYKPLNLTELSAHYLKSIEDKQG